MNSHVPTLRHRIEEVEERVAQRQERLKLRWADARRSTRAFVWSPLQSPWAPLVAVGAGLLLVYAVVRRPTRVAKAGGLVGMLMAAGLALLRRRYGSPYALVWRFLSHRPPPAQRVSR